MFQDDRILRKEGPRSVQVRPYICSYIAGREGFWELRSKTSPTLIHIESNANLRYLSAVESREFYIGVNANKRPGRARNLRAAVSRCARRFPLKPRDRNGCPQSIRKTSGCPMRGLKAGVRAVNFTLERRSCNR